MTRLPAAARDAYHREMNEARRSSSVEQRWRHLERAHILSQPDPWLHTGNHAATLARALRQRDRREAFEPGCPPHRRRAGIDERRTISCGQHRHGRCRLYVPMAIYPTTSPPPWAADRTLAISTVNVMESNRGALCPRWSVACARGNVDGRNIGRGLLGARAGDNAHLHRRVRRGPAPMAGCGRMAVPGLTFARLTGSRWHCS